MRHEDDSTENVEQESGQRHGKKRERKHQQRTRNEKKSCGVLVITGKWRVLLDYRTLEKPHKHWLFRHKM
jgi:hypothetical protein